MYEAITDRFVDPSIVVSHFHLRAGDKVADLGAGSGHYMGPLSQAVGREGLVYACEVQKSLVDALAIKAQAESLTNIRTVWGDIEVFGGTKLQDGALDAVLISNTLFQVDDKEGLAKETMRILRKGGKLFVIDWTESFGGIGPAPAQVLGEDTAKQLLTQAGFVFERSLPTGEHHYGIALRK